MCGLQYVGSIIGKFRFRWNNHEENNCRAKREEEHMQSLVSEHSSSIDHNNFLEECSITLMDRTDGSDPTRGEEYWRRVTPIKTVTPYGLNKVE